MGILTTMILAHKIRLEPTSEQVAYFCRACGTARFAYNWALNEWQTQYNVGGKPKVSDLAKQFNSIRHQAFPWSGEVSKSCTSQPFRNLGKAFDKFFKKTAKYPIFKKKGQRDSFYVANDKIRFDGNFVRLPVIGWVKLSEKLRFDGKTMSATVSRTANHWFCSVQVEMPDYRKERSATATEVVGIDLGLKTFAVLSNGQEFHNPRPLKVALKKLQTLGRRHSRKVKGSNNRKKAQVKLAVQHAKVANIRKDFLHKTTTEICKNHAVIVIEDLNVKGMVKNHCLARSISDSGWGEFRRQLTYKVKIFGNQLIVANRFEPSSKRCSSCGKVKAKLGLSERKFVCDECGVVEDRDVNAAINLEQIGWVTAELTPVDIEALA